MQVATRVSLILLLFGTIIGDFALLADVGTRAAQRLHTANYKPPDWLVGSHGRVIMILLALCPVLPLCCMRRSVFVTGHARVGSRWPNCSDSAADRPMLVPPAYPLNGLLMRL